ncbi:MAG: DeoR family transcriptional regulator [Niastella sp. SCN 39-18]|nr:DeoR/GlpR transcriptional regulator [Sphingobacteriales bacterium]ODT52096.1 MAG: DeoR family transcriptional regulator [Niastella sp. SCN 39-18]OJW11056.1 MAG: DeoR family transcriptional regulator [Sphingobacteriales bacterium 39-19]
MLKKERQAYILHQVNLHNKVVSATLSAEIAVSEDTIRRDLQELSETGKLVKVHGGALSAAFYDNPVMESNVYAQTDKQRIGNKAASLVKDGMFILTGGGTTVLEFARCLPSSLKATFISGSIPAISEYMNHPNIEIIVLGDKLSKTSRITVGADAVNRIKNIKADLCILGINAIDTENGVTDNDWDVVQIKQQMIASSHKTICLTISEKINTVQPIHVCGLDKIDSLITELDPGHKLLKPFKDAGITIL